MYNLEELFKLAQIIFVDLVLAGDNAIVIGLVAAKFSKEYRRKVILYGVGVAVILRILFAILTVQLLAITGLMLAGGLLLLWICWKLWVDLREPSVHTPAVQHPEREEPDALAIRGGKGATDTGKGAAIVAGASLSSSIMQIVLADISMSLDNVLAVAGIADGHTGLLVIGLAISVAFMTFAAALIADILQKHRWIGYVGLAMIFYVALRMIYDGGVEVLPLLT